MKIEEWECLRREMDYQSVIDECAAAMHIQQIKNYKIVRFEIVRSFLINLPYRPTYAVSSLKNRDIGYSIAVRGLNETQGSWDDSPVEIFRDNNIAVWRWGSLTSPAKSKELFDVAPGTPAVMKYFMSKELYDIVSIEEYEELMLQYWNKKFGQKHNKSLLGLLAARRRRLGTHSKID
jgi:hypothetical protein